MTWIEIVLLLVIAGVCGAVAQAIAGYTRTGCLASIGLGFIGALLGTFIARAMGLPELFPIVIGGRTYPIVWSILGATIFVAILNLIQRRRIVP